MDLGAITALTPSAGSPLFAESVARLPAAQQRKVVAQQFEAILLRELLAPVMDSVSGVGHGVYGYLATDAFAQKLSAGRGLGLAGIIERQLSPSPAPAASGAAGNPPAHS